jgi:hypothetical protein
MKAFLSILLGLMLLTSLVGISYATPTMQPTRSGGDNNSCVLLPPDDPDYVTLGCPAGAHQGNDNPPQHGCLAPGQKNPDGTCCPVGITPHSLEVSDIHADVVCER